MCTLIGNQPQIWATLRPHRMAAGKTHVNAAVCPTRRMWEGKGRYINILQYIGGKLLVHSVPLLMRLIMHFLYKDNAWIEPNVSTINQSNKMSKFAQNLRYIFPRIRFFVLFIKSKRTRDDADSSGSFVYSIFGGKTSWRLFEANGNDILWLSIFLALV